MNRKKGLIGMVSLAISFSLMGQTPLSLKEAQNLALSQNKAVLNAKLDLQNADSKIWEVIASGLPQVNGKLSYRNAIEIPVSVVNASIFDPDAEPGALTQVALGQANNLEANVQVNQLIFDGSYIVGVQSSKTFKKLAELSLKLTKANILEAVTNAYGGVVIASESLALTQKNLEVVEANYSDMKVMVEFGLATEQDATQIELEVYNLKNEIEKARVDVHNSKNLLKLIVGMELKDKIKILDNSQELVLMAKSMAAENKEKEIETFLDYKMASAQEKAQQLLLRNEYMGYLPSISSFYTYSLQSQSPEFTFFGEEQSRFSAQNIGITLNAPLFTSFGRQAKINQAKRNFLKAQKDKIYKKNELSIEYATAKNNLEFSLKQLHNAKRSMDLAQEISEQEGVKYKEGITSSTQLMNVKNQLYRSQGLYLSSLNALIQAKAKIEKITSNK